MSRRESREAAIKLLFQYDFHGGSIEGLTRLFFENDAEFVSEKVEKEYVVEVTEGALSKYREIDAIIEAHSKDWKISRMPRVDVAILRVAVYEILFEPGLDTGVSISEAVEIAKGYAEKESVGYINGILGAIAREREVENG